MVYALLLYKANQKLQLLHQVASHLVYIWRAYSVCCVLCYILFSGFSLAVKSLTTSDVLPLLSTSLSIIIKYTKIVGSRSLWKVAFSNTSSVAENSGIFLFGNLQDWRLLFFSTGSNNWDEKVNPLSNGGSWVILLNFLCALVKL